MGTIKKPAPTKQAGSSKLYYDHQFAVTTANKTRRAKRRAAWLAHRQSEDVRLRMATAWSERHFALLSKPHITALRYGIPLYVNTKHKKED